MKATLILVCLTISSLVFSQTPAEWQLQNPDGILISQSVYDQMSAKEISLLGKEVFVFDDRLVHEKSNQSPENTNVSGKDESIKAWLSFHPDVMIVKHSEFLVATDAQKTIMESHHALILSGETLTLEDISNYPY